MKELQLHLQLHVHADTCRRMRTCKDTRARRTRTTLPIPDPILPYPTYYEHVSTLRAYPTLPSPYHTLP